MKEELLQKQREGLDSLKIELLKETHKQIKEMENQLKELETSVEAGVEH